MGRSIGRWLRGGAALAGVVCLAAGLGGGTAVLAQGVCDQPNAPPECAQLRSLPPSLQQEFERVIRTGENGGGVVQPPTMQPTQQQPTAPPVRWVRPPRPPSPLEKAYGERAGARLELQGYATFRDGDTGAGAPSPLSGAIQESYVLGPGDELILRLFGRTNQIYRLAVDRDGQVALPGQASQPAAGLPFGDFRRQVERLVAETMPGTSVAVSLAALRQVAVIVSGELNNPGYVTVSGLSTVVDAIQRGGGIKDTGSLRGIQIFRQGRAQTVDLYGVLFGLSAPQLSNLAEGDIVTIPTLGRTAAVSGRVKRPGIYELPAGSETLAAVQLLELAGGPLVQGAHAYAVMRLKPDGGDEIVPVKDLSRITLGDGEILFVEPAKEVIRGAVNLEGHVRLPGRRPLVSAPNVRTLVGSAENLLPDPYLPLAVRETMEPRSHTRVYEKFDLQAILDGRQTLSLRQDDRVIVLGMSDIQFLASRDVATALQGRGPENAQAAVRRTPSGEQPHPGQLPPGVQLPPGTQLPPANGQTGGAPTPATGGQMAVEQPCAGLAVLSRNVRSNPRGELATGQFARALRELGVGPMPCPKIFDTYPQLLTYLIENSVLVRGNVLRPGIYPVVGLGQADLITAIAGGQIRPRGTQARPALIPAKPTELRKGQGDPAAIPLTAAIPSSGAGEVLDIAEARINLLGHVRLSGTRSLAAAPTLKSVIGDPEVFSDGPYLLFGIVARLDPLTLFRQYIFFAPAKVLDGSFDMALQNRDEIRIFGAEEVQQLTRGAAEAALREERAKAVRSAQAAAPTPSAQAVPAGAGAAPAPGEQVFAAAPLARLLVENGVQLIGEVRLPGVYPVVESVSLGDVLAAAGGASTAADLRAVEVTSSALNPSSGVLEARRATIDLSSRRFDAVLMGPGDVARLPPLGSERDIGTVELAGEVWRPGRYDLVAGERLSSVLARAGGLKATAFPYGTLFTRDSVRVAERQLFGRVAEQLDKNLAGALVSPGAGSNRQPPLSGEAATVVRNLLDDLRNVEPPGRVVVEADPAILQARPEFDIVMEAGDRIFIPKRPLSVMVGGEVLNSGAQQFESGKSARAYVEQAGGVTQFADRSRAFLVLPNGQARAIGLSAWKLGEEPIPPGSTIIIPRDFQQLDFLSLTGVLADITSKLAVSMASLAVIGR